MSKLEELFPNLTHCVWKQTSDATDQYNCIAYAAGDETRWWDCDEDYYWPEGALRDGSLESAIQAYAVSGGYIACNDGGQEDDVEKVAVYGNRTGYTHAAIQKANGNWGSKLGSLEDIEHDTLAAVECPIYGTVQAYLRRERI